MSYKTQQDKLKPGYPWTARQRRMKRSRKARKVEGVKRGK